MCQSVRCSVTVALNVCFFLKKNTHQHESCNCNSSCSRTYSSFATKNKFFLSVTHSLSRSSLGIYHIVFGLRLGPSIRRLKVKAITLPNYKLVYGSSPESVRMRQTTLKHPWLGNEVFFAGSCNVVIAFAMQVFVHIIVGLWLLSPTPPRDDPTLFWNLIFFLLFFFKITAKFCSFCVVNLFVCFWFLICFWTFFLYVELQYYLFVVVLLWHKLSWLAAYRLGSPLHVRIFLVVHL